MGRDKALVEVDGIPMVLHVVAALRAAGCDPVVVIGGDREALAGLGLAVVTDAFPGQGPLGGVITALDHHVAADAVVVAACDLPHLTEATVRLVIGALHGSDVVMPRTDRVQPMCAAWRRSVTECLRSAFIAGERGLQNAAQELLVVEISVNPQDLANVNAPGDLLQ